jgi:hypothetical protein
MRVDKKKIKKNTTKNGVKILKIKTQAAGM